MDAKIGGLFQEKEILFSVWLRLEEG